MMHADKACCPCEPHHLTQAQGLWGCIGSFYLVVSYILHAWIYLRLACHTTCHAYRLLFLSSLQNQKVACDAQHIKGFGAKFSCENLRQVRCKRVPWIPCCKCPNDCCHTQICCITVVHFIACSLIGCLWLMLAQLLGTRRLLLLHLRTVRLPAYVLPTCEQHKPQYKLRLLGDNASHTGILRFETDTHHVHNQKNFHGSL